MVSERQGNTVESNEGHLILLAFVHGRSRYIYHLVASAIKCCDAVTGMDMTAAAAVLRESANTRTSLSHMTTHRRHTKMSRRVSRRVASPACIAGVRVSRPNFSAPCGRTMC